MPRSTVGAKSCYGSLLEILDLFGNCPLVRNGRLDRCHAPDLFSAGLEKNTVCNHTGNPSLPLSPKHQVFGETGADRLLWDSPGKDFTTFIAVNEV